MKCRNYRKMKMKQICLFFLIFGLMFLGQEIMVQASIMDGLKGDLCFKNAIMLFNGTLDILYGILETNPTSGSYNDVWQVVKSLNTTFSSIGGTLITIFFLWGFCRDSIDIKQEVNMDATAKMFIRYIITVNVTTMAILWFPKLFSWAIALLGVTNSDTFKISADALAEQLSEVQTPLVGFLLGLLFLLASVACCALMIWTCFGRFINLYILIPFSSIALSTLAGGGQISSTGYAYIKNILVYTFEIVAMGVVLAIAGAFIKGVSFASQDNGLMMMVEALVKMLTVSSALKGCDSLIRKAFNM